MKKHFEDVSPKKSQGIFLVSLSQNFYKVLTAFLILFISGWFSFSHQAYAANNPTVDSVTPAGGTAPVGEWINFTTQVSDADGVDGNNIRGIYFLIQSPLTSENQANPTFPNSVQLLYRNDLNKLFLLNDTGATWLGNATPQTLNIFIENSQAKVDVYNTTVGTSSNMITINWRIQFKAPYSGQKYNSYLKVYDNFGYSSGWIQKGAWTVKAPEVWMSLWRNAPAALGQPGAAWDFVKQNVNGFKILRSNVDTTWMSRTDLQQTISVLTTNNIPIHIELFGPDPRLCPINDSNGQCSAQYDMTNSMNPVRDMGAQIKFVDIDWQVKILLDAVAAVYPTQTPQENRNQCLSYLINYINEIRQIYPDVEFFLLSNFEWWRWKGGPSNPMAGDWGDYWDIVTTMIPGTKNAGVPLRGITVEYAYDYMIQGGNLTWLRHVLDFENYAHSENLEFNLILNSWNGMTISDDLFESESLDSLDLYRKAGGHPDRYIVENWFTHPTVDEIVPESTSGTMTHLVKTVLERVLVPPDITTPFTAIATPLGSSFVKGIVSLISYVFAIGHVFDAGGIQSVQFMIDGNAFGAPFTTRPYNLNWDTSLVSEGSHTITAIAADIAGSSTSTPVSVTVDNTKPTTPLLSITAVTDTSISLMWNAQDNIGITRYKLYRDAVEPYLVNDLRTTFTDTFTAGSFHTYRVYAVDAAVNFSDASNTVSNVNQPPLPPSNLTATIFSASRIDLSWIDNSNNETGFQIYRSTSSSGPFTQIGSIGQNVTIYSDTGLTPNTYYYKVKATGIIGVGDSDYSNTASVILIPAPSNLTATAISSTQINLTWTDNSNNETGFLIERSTSSRFTSMTTIPVGAHVGTGTINFSNTGLAKKTWYYYRLRATNAVGSSAPSNVASARTRN